MKLRVWLAAAAMMITAMAAGNASGQVNVYVDFSAAKLTNLVGTSVLYGPTVGAAANFAKAGPVQLAFDLRGAFLGGSQRLDQISLGPKATLGTRHADVYAEFLVGYARYNDGLGNPASASTDGEFQIIAGLDHAVTKHVSWRVFEFGYEQYYGLGGQFNPKTFSTGAVYRF